ncbi:hypothetical protein LBMAG42_13490 [Deltaproteobacteria bacterium]|nr:hypothetical protein LBMAG42_13490 [Deltaproteobacteria bacterium]
MGSFNAIFTAIFNVVLAPFGHGFPWFDLVLWPLLGGILALLVIKAVSNQAGITRAKNFIQVHLLEIVLFRDDLRVVLPATAKALAYNVMYLGYNIVPMLVMIVPMTAILVQLVSHYAQAPLPVGETVLIVAKLDGEVQGVAVRDVTLELPAGLSLDAPPVRSADGEIAWRVRLDAPGDFVLKLHAGSVTEEKSLAVGGEARKVSVLRTKSWEALLYPAEPVPAADSPIESISILDRDDQPLRGLPDGEGGVLAWFFGVSLLAGFLLKDLFGVTL